MDTLIALTYFLQLTENRRAALTCTAAERFSVERCYLSKTRRRNNANNNLS